MLLISTVGELKNFIKDLPEDTKVLAYRSDMEQHRYQPNVGVRSENMVSVKRETSEVFYPTHDDTGTLCLLIGQ